MSHVGTLHGPDNPSQTEQVAAYVPWGIMKSIIDMIEATLKNKSAYEPRKAMI